MILNSDAHSFSFSVDYGPLFCPVQYAQLFGLIDSIFPILHQYLKLKLETIHLKGLMEVMSVE